MSYDASGHNGSKEWIQKNAQGVKDWEKFINEVTKKFGMARRRARDTITRLRREGKIPRDALMSPSKFNVSTITTKHVGKSFRMSVDLAVVAGEYDEEAKILTGLENLGTRLIKDNDFRVELGIPIDRWKVVCNMQKFANNKRELKGKRFRGVFWGRTEIIRELSKKIDILP